MAKIDSENNKNIKKGSLADLEKRRKESDAPSIVPQKKKNLLRALKVIILVFAFLGILCLVLWGVNSCLQKEKGTDDGNMQMHFNPDGVMSVDYYEPDYGVNILEEPEYLAKDRKIRYVDGNMSIVLDEYEDRQLDPGQRFFKNYFESVINGDFDSYHGFFDGTENINPKIYAGNLTSKKFPMQRLYAIEVEKLMVSEDENNVYNGKKAIFGIYEVSYRIMKNDGEFRLGLPSDKIVPVIYQTATTDAGTDSERTVITKAYLYDDIATEPESKEGTDDK